MGHGDAKLFLGWHDAKLDVDCSFRKAEDGALRCMPWSTGVVVFRDPGCTSAIWINEEGETATPKFVPGDAEPAAACAQADLAYPIYAVHEEVQPGQRYRPTKSGGCEAVALDMGVQTFAVEKLAPAELVKGETSTVPLTAEFAVTELKAEDGAEGLTGIVDAARGVTCDATEMADGTLRCVPQDDGSSVAYVAYAEDASCMDRLAYRVVDASLSCPTPTIAFAYPPTGSCASWLLFAVGDEVNPTTLYHGDQPGKADCALEQEIPPDHQFFHVGAALDVTKLPAVSVVPASNGEQLTLGWYQTSDVRIEPAGLWDEKLGAACTETMLCKAGNRCVPATAFIDFETYYRDTACTEEVARTPATDCDATPPAFALGPNGACFDVFELGAEVHGTVYERSP
ncbi:MAG TPA: hypothetical protein VHB21_19780, partial [Minicystis sp.]|nr:hypothetical protein [Minicystis sp.]